MTINNKGIEFWLCLGMAFLLFGNLASAQKNKNNQNNENGDNEPTATLDFVVLKKDNGKPVRNAAVIMHSVSAQGKQSRGDLELKTDQDGKASFDGVPYGTLRVQVLASGFQTFGQDYDISRPQLDFTIELSRPQGQYSIYGPGASNGAKPPDSTAKPQ